MQLGFEDPSLTVRAVINFNVFRHHGVVGAVAQPENHLKV